MIIKKIAMFNFGVYAGENTIVLNSEKPVVLIGGLNGRGKTTLLEAVLLALYGSNSFAFTESKYKTYGEYLRNHVNMNDGSGNSYVELEFQMNDETDQNTYTVKRIWSNDKRRIHEKVAVEKNHLPDDFLAKNWMMFIESVLPSALSNFFFFDGEKIAEIAENDTGLQMKESIKALLGINILDTLGSDLKKIEKKLTEQSSEDVDILALKTLRNEKDAAEERLQKLDRQISGLEKDVAALQKKLTEKRNRFEEKGGDILRNTMDLYSEQATNSAMLAELDHKIYAIAASEFPLQLVAPLLKNILRQSELEKESSNHQIAVQTMEALLQTYCKNGKTDEELMRFISFVKETVENAKTDAVFQLSDFAGYQLKSLLDSGLNTLASSLHHYRSRKAALQKRNDEIASYLSVDINEKEVRKIYKEIKEIEFKLESMDAELARLNSARKTANGVFLNKKSEFSRFVENSLSAFEKNDDIERMLSFTLLAEQVNEQYKTALQRAKIRSLADTMTACYQKLLGKKNLISEIEMDPDTLDYYFLDSNGNDIERKSLSAGEKQLMIISMLWALALCSKKKLPVIIDTPMARLDSVHRNALIEQYFPYASDQTIILSTDSEIYGDYYTLLKKNSSNQFTLVYDEERKCSTIQTGYFGEG